MAKRKTKAKRKSSPKRQANTGVKYSLLFALVLLLVAFLLIFANGPVEDGTEELTGNLLVHGQHELPPGSYGNTDEVFGSNQALMGCVDQDAVYGYPESYLVGGYAGLVDMDGNMIPGAPVRYDVCYRSYLAEMKCNAGMVSYDLVDCDCVEEFVGEHGENDVRARCVAL